ncbi:uncharacterized protein LOC131343978 [Hemibagrus wyckioides]|uniref:uncharacterized protein LOC131343978 n=1 Tax=Hemibagrus wyckioides TaxID=337641 RepID=UPI00266CE0A5|nr:uncharacterized protein LOC131343978 [Hemibagrus wyckioides]
MWNQPAPLEMIPFTPSIPRISQLSVTNSGTEVDTGHVESASTSGDDPLYTQHSENKSAFSTEVTNSGTEVDTGHVESASTSGDDPLYTQHSENKSAFSTEVTNSGTEVDTGHVESASTSGDDPLYTQHSENKSAFSTEVTNSGTEVDTGHVESASTSGDDPLYTQHSENKSAFSTEVTNSGTEVDTGHVESASTSGDDPLYTQHSENKSAFSTEVTNSGTEVDTGHVESASTSGDDPLYTQHSENKSAFSTEVKKWVMDEKSHNPESGDNQQQASALLNQVADEMFAGDQYCILYTVDTSTPQLHEVSSHDACSISSLENSEDDYVPESSYSSSDTSACSHTISCTKKKAETKKNLSLSPTTGLSSAIADSEAEVGQSSSVLVRGISKTSKKPRVYDKKQYCLFCSKPLSKMARHLEQVHSTESEVAKALSFPKGSKERKNLLDHLRNRGNFAHNAEVVQSGKGDLVPCKKPRKDCDSKTFVHCSNCQGLFARKYLWCHMKRCELSKNVKSHPKPGKNRVLSQNAYMGPAPPGTSAGLWKLLSNMTYDSVLLAINSDFYIRRLGECFYNRVGSDISKHEYIRQKMREVGRLLITAREVTPLRKMEDFIDPANFMYVITAVRKSSGYDEEKCTFQRPSLALKLGHSLQKIASLVSFQAMMDRDSERAEKARNFSEMYMARWSELISSHALRTQREVKWNAPLVLPFTEDVKMLHLFLDQKQEEYFQSLSKDASTKNWSQLAKIALAQTILFNRRREGEVSKMPLKAFISRNADDLHEDIALALSELEKKLCNHFTRIEIRGKRGRKVPVLLTPVMQKNMELLVEKRENCGIPSENIYMFARPAALSHFRGSDCLREFATECGARNPKALSSTKLRKHIATLSNVLNLNNTELDQLADFLGHDVRVHREYYRLPEGTLQLAKISKILMALETGRLGEFTGKNLDDIDIDPNEAVFVQSSDFSRDLSGTENESDDDLGADLHLEPSPKQAHETSADQAAEPTSSTSVPKGVKVIKKKKWETSEVKAVEKHLDRFIKTCTVPGKKDCEACIKAEPVALKDRDWLSVKFFVKNRITALKRKM